MYLRVQYFIINKYIKNYIKLYRYDKTDTSIFTTCLRPGPERSVVRHGTVGDDNCQTD